jgi:hypothetical protein
MTSRTRPTMYRFDPVAVGRAECAAWVAYYRHEWVKVLAASLKLVRESFGMPWPRTIRGAWLVLRANQAWAPYPDNQPDAARADMRAFYDLIVTDQQLAIDPAEAARREVEWWRVHRIHQRQAAVSEPELSGALVNLYSYVYSVPPESVREAADHRVEAMRLSDAWVEAGCDRTDERLRAERRALVASYSALRFTVWPPGISASGHTGQT